MPQLLPPAPHRVRQLLAFWRRAAVSAVGVLALLAVASAAWASGSSPGGSGASLTGTHRTRLSGAGSTFDAPFFKRAFARYHRSHPGVSVSYAAVGSSAGIARFAAGHADFGASDTPASKSDLAGARGGAVVQVPAVLGGVTVAYNVLRIANHPLKLTGPVLSRIFLGQITRWDDPAITHLNPGADLPDVEITVVHRSDGSGTTYIFSNYLSEVSPAWAASVGTGRSLSWPAGYAARGNGGVAAAIARIPDSIGYVEHSYTVGTALGVAAIRNSAGRYVTPTTAAISADARTKSAITPASFSIVNQGGRTAYPICGYSWILVSARQHSQATGMALVAFLRWLTHAGQVSGESLGYVALPPRVQREASAALTRLVGPRGQVLGRK